MHMITVRSLRLSAALLLVAGPVAAAPLGLNPGDIVEQLEWSNTNAGGVFTPGTPGTAAIDGTIESVTINPSITSLLSDVTFSLDLDLSSQSAVSLGGTLLATSADFVGSSTIAPDFTISDTSGIILQGNLTTPLTLEGVVDLANIVNPSFIGDANIVITGGETNLVTALGGLGGTGVIEISGGIFNFSPGLGTLLADLNAFDDSFTFSGSGIITPDSTSPFVPEPSTAMLLATGLLGLLGFSRRAQRRP